MVMLISQNACLEAERHAAMKQATSASKAAESLMSSGSTKDESALEKKLKETETGTTTFEFENYLDY